MFAAAAVALLVTMAMALARALLGPTIFDRILAVNMVGTKAVLLLAVFSFLIERPEFVDLALLYALINFAGVMAVLKFIQYQDLGHSGAPKPGDREPN